MGVETNPAYTPTFMLNLASQFTGKRYKRRELIRAADDVAEFEGSIVERAGARQLGIGISTATIFVAT